MKTLKDLKDLFLDELPDMYDAERRNRDSTYTSYQPQPTYRTAYEGPHPPGQKYEEVQADLQREYETSKGNAGLAWSKAKPAPRDAWNRADATSPVDFQE